MRERYAWGPSPASRPGSGRAGLGTVGRPLQDDHRDLAPGPSLVVGEARHQLPLPGPDAVALLPLGDAGHHVAGLRSDLDPGLRVRDEVVVPVGVAVGTALGPEHGHGAVAQV